MFPLVLFCGLPVTTFSCSARCLGRVWAAAPTGRGARLSFPGQNLGKRDVPVGRPRTPLARGKRAVVEKRTLRERRRLASIGAPRRSVQQPQDSFWVFLSPRQTRPGHQDGGKVESK